MAITSTEGIQLAQQAGRGHLRSVGRLLRSLFDATANVVANKLTAGQSGSAGTLEVYPSTALKGKLTITTTDNTGDNTTAVVVAAQSTARTIAFAPDTGYASPVINAQGVVTESSTGTNMKAAGTSILPTTAGSEQTFILSNPVVGYEKTIVQSAGSTAITVQGTTSGITFTSTSGTPASSFIMTAAGSSITLLALSTTQWQVKSKVGGITL